MRRFVERFRRGWLLGREAVGILRAFPKLLILPALSAAAMVALIAVLMSPAVHAAVMKFLISAYLETATAAAVAGVESNQMLHRLPWRLFAVYGLLVLWLVYALLATIAFFFNVALVASLVQFDRTGTVSLRLGLRVGVLRLPQILAWALFAATIGALLKIVTRILEQYLSTFGSYVGIVGELAFAVAAYFVAPVVAVDGVGPITALRRSASLIKARWGNVVGAETSTFWYFWPLYLVGLLGLLGIWYLPSELHQLRLAALVAFIGCFAIAMALGFVTSSVIMSRLYSFTLTGIPPRGSDPAIYSDVFRRK